MYKEKNNMRNLIEIDYLEIIDFRKRDLMKYTKADLIDLIYHQAACLHDAERALEA